MKYLAHPSQQCGCSPSLYNRSSTYYLCSLPDDRNSRQKQTRHFTTEFAVVSFYFRNELYVQHHLVFSKAKRCPIRSCEQNKSLSLFKAFFCTLSFILPETPCPITRKLICFFFVRRRHSAILWTCRAGSWACSPSIRDTWDRA